MKWDVRSCVVAVLWAFVANAATLGQQPNIMFIMADDLGWGDTSTGAALFGDPNSWIQTPNLDELASQGMQFDSAYATPSCASTRTMLYSGQYPTRPTNTVYSVLQPTAGDGMSIPQGIHVNGISLPSGAITFAERLQVAGYETAHMGKWHIGNATGASSPTSRGFDQNYGGTNSGGPGAYHASSGTFGGSIDSGLDPYAANYTQDYVDNNIKPFAASGNSVADMNALVGTPKHVTDAEADAFMDYVTTVADQNAPWYVNYMAYAPHFPVDNSEARADLLTKYQGIANPSTQYAPYGALVEGLDQSLGRIKDFLENTPDPRNPGHNLDENTLLIFYSDNGGEFTPSGDNPRPNFNVADNGPTRGDKVMLLEGGIREPMIAWSGNPNLVDGGTVVHEIVGTLDFYRTFVDLAGGTEPANYPLDGVSLKSLFADSNVQLDRSLVYHFPGYNNFGGSSADAQTLIRRDDWKLVFFYASQTWELYDLATDLDETDNVVDEHPEVVGKLAIELIQWMVDQDAPLMTLTSGARMLSIDGLAYSNGQITLEGDHNYTSGQEIPFTISHSLLPAGDFDLDGDVDPDDVDLLAAHVGSSDPIDLFLYDVNEDGVIDFHANGTGTASDSDYLIRTVVGTEYGDANLDGVVDIADLDLLGQGFENLGTGWLFGDFDGSGGLTDIGDLDLLGQWWHFGVSSLASANTVPEPPATMLLLVAAVVLPLVFSRNR